MSGRYAARNRRSVPIELPHDDPDYDHYVDKQLKPIADGVLGLEGRSFDELTGQSQLSLF